VESEVQRAIWLANKMGMHGIPFTAPYGKYLVTWGNAETNLQEKESTSM
jgi:vancomycin permeability regulator SanA